MKRMEFAADLKRTPGPRSLSLSTVPAFHHLTLVLFVSCRLAVRSVERRNGRGSSFRHREGREGRTRSEAEGSLEADYDDNV